MERKKYFVTLDQPFIGISDIKSPENTVQYEIRATKREKDQLADLVQSINIDDIESQQILIRPFKEKTADIEKAKTGEEIQRLYQFIYDLGTEETQKIIKNLSSS